MLAVVGEARAGDVKASEDLRRRLVESEHDLDVAVGVLRYYCHSIAGANSTGGILRLVQINTEGRSRESTWFPRGGCS